MYPDPTEQPSPPPALQYSVFTNREPLTKQFELRADGTLKVTPAAQMSSASVRRAAAANLREFVAQLDALTVHEAVTYGLAERDGPVVTLRALAAHPGAIARTSESMRFAQGPGILFLDSDAGLGLDELLPLLFTCVPELQRAPMVARQSTSAGVHQRGRPPEFGKWHLYVAVADVSRVETAGKLLQERLWAQREVCGLEVAWPAVTAAGAVRYLSLLDGTVHQPERLDFVARPMVGGGLDRVDLGPIFVNEDASLFDLDCIRVTPEQHARADANRVAAKGAVRPESEHRRAGFLAAQRPKIMERRGLSAEQADRVLTRATDEERPELAGDFTLLTQRGEWVSVHEVLTDRERFPLGSRFADPLEPDYDDGRRVAVLCGSEQLPHLYSHAHGAAMQYRLALDTQAVGFGVQPAPVSVLGEVAAPTAGDVAPNAAELAHLVPLEESEDGLALKFAEQALPQFRWTPGAGWMVNAGSMWQRDECLQRYDAARRVCRVAAAAAATAPEKRRLSSAKTVAAVLTLAQADLRLIVPSGAWDADPFALNVPAGVVDLRDGSLQARAGQLHTLCAAVTPDMAAAAPLFERFMEQVFLGDLELVAFVQRMLGYCLTGDRREQVLFFWHGAGANGKSTLLDLLQWILGTYSIKLAGSTLMTSRNERHPTEIAQLRSRRLACSSELEEGSFFNEPLLKELTGDSTASARFMRGDFFEFAQTQKHIVVGNFRPRLRGGDPAMARRIVLVPFNASFPPATRDPKMLAKLKAEAPAVLAWMVRGALDWQAGGLRIPARVRSESAEYMALHDDVALWRQERCEPSGESRASELYSNFKSWKESRGEHAPSATVWFQRLESQPGIAKTKGRSAMLYRGISITSVVGQCNA